MSDFKPMLTAEKKEFGKQFSKEERISYRKGQRNAYSHMGNTAHRQSKFINENLKNDKPAPAKTKGK